jgi:uncharacterized membrane protein
VNETLSWSADLGRSSVVLAGLLALLGIGLLVVLEGSAAKRGRAAVLSTGIAATILLLFAVLRPVRVTSRASVVGPKVVVLADVSRSMDLPGDEGKRRDGMDASLKALDQRGGDVRLQRLAFGLGAPVPLAGAPIATRSDLATALEFVGHAADERPAAIIVISDGRLDRPPSAGAAAAVKAALGQLEVPVHTVAVASNAPNDASVRAVRAAGAAVAHQPFSLEVEVGCEGLSCNEVPVTVRELRETGAPTMLASGTARVTNGTATVALPLTIERAGARILEVEITSPKGDTIPDNDKRYISLDVGRDRVRLLHVAGRPTYDVRALRMWLKADASLDLVTFFILRTRDDQVQAGQDELALIPFPVDELFEEHLPSFDAVVLQDFNAEPYGLTKHLKSLASYVKKGGGLIMVGGQDSFVAGNYAKTPLSEVLPVELDSERGALPADVAFFTPELTSAGRVAPVLGPLRDLIGDELPEMPGTSVVGDAKKDTTVLMTHPTRRTKSGAPMPVLALGEVGSGRTIALSIDGSHRLLFSNFAANQAGRAHGAFWDGLLGWLMRDPRFEPAVLEPKGGCIASEESTLVLRPLPGPAGKAKITITRLGSGAEVRSLTADVDGTGKPVDIAAGKLDPGGYSALVQITTNEKSKAGPATRRDFACERGGDEWADSRPDVDRLRAIAAATNGTFVFAKDVASIPFPAATQIAAERRVAPILPPWAWTALAGLAVGAHWIVRRRSGLA